MEIADALKVKGLVPLACKTDRIDSWVLAELSRPELLLTIWLPDPDVRAERERLVTAFTSCAIGPCSRTGSMRRWSRSANPVRSLICSLLAGASCSGA